MPLLARFTYYRRIQISFLLLILLPFIAVSWLTYSNTKKLITTEARLTNETMLAIMAKDIATLIEELTYASNFFIQDSNVRKSLRSFVHVEKINSYEDYSHYEQIKAFFNLVASQPLIMDLRMFIVNDKQFIVPSVEGDAQQMLQIEKHRLLLSPLINHDRPDVLQWLGSVPDGIKPGESYYYAVRVIRDPADNLVLGHLFVGIPESNFRKLFQQLGLARFAIYDDKGHRIAGESQVLLHKAKATEQSIRSEVVIARSGWTLIYEDSNQKVTGQISKSFFISLLLVIPFFALFLVISVLIARSLHQPIRNLQRGARLFGEGNRSMRFQVKGTDEIAQLGRTLNDMLDQINMLITDIEQEQEQKRVLELQALFAQIRPHFLLNTLNSIKCSLFLEGNSRHSSKIESLMSLLRAYMKVHELTTLHNECKLLVSYIDIMKMRSEMPIELEVELTPGTEHFQVPKLVLQPLVENAVIHGFAEKEKDARIIVSAERPGQYIEIRISDNGGHLQEQKVAELSAMLQASETHSSYKRVGLINVLQRLQLTYGSSVTMQAKRNEHHGLTVVLRIPCLEAFWNGGI